MQPELSSTPVTVVKNPGRERYEIFTAEDPVQFAGFVELQHTIISEGFSRRGFARTLVTSVLDQIRDEGGLIVPTCSYVQDYLQRFPQYADLVTKA